MLTAMAGILDGYELDDARERLDRDAIWRFLSTEAYWHRWRTRDLVETQIDSAWRVVGLYHGADQVGFGRVISDGVTLAYLADVYVLGPHRGRGLGVALTRELVEGGGAADMRWLLHTADAHGLYERLGFRTPPETLMERPGAQRPPTRPGGQ
ncbi:MAG: Histone acetyltransferase HPA2 and related acetyltransferases [uncultured Solirubrobacteraceae bacterium]|uniref:Histone acetyltransferase HPA2 and related acetyltransferases n=1 Tax=uncultured Solirubrobacteraceae bacterium TaxID=1162706 RepID=A0A6J4S6Q8_9ACTN|nr:MAG: Histone acetyltransferase HPA2 and related acetyltransferases [uncultured Solirubrobacteraceae bacterium]